MIIFIKITLVWMTLLYSLSMGEVRVRLTTVQKVER